MEFQEPLHVVFVHGLFSSPDTWTTMVTALEGDAIVAQQVRIHVFGYSSPRLSLNPTKRIPDIDDIADALGVYLDVDIPKSEPIVLVAHSQGGLIVQRYITRRLSEGRGGELQRIQGIVLYATPNSGSEFFFPFRKGLSNLIRHPQERELRPFLSSLADTQRQFLQSVVYAEGVASSKCFIPVVAYAGVEDAIVSPASARASFPNGGNLPGDHLTIIRPNDANDARYLVLKNVIASALAKLSPTKPSPEAQPEPHIAVTPVPTIPVHRVDQPSSETIKARIARTLFEVNEFRNELDRQEIIRFLPPHIGSEIRSNQSARLAIMSLVTACDRFGDAGHLALFEALDVACPPEDPHVQMALVMLRETWDLRPYEG